MRVLSIISLILASCISSDKNKNEAFPSLATSNDEWTIYEGKWLAHDGILRLELSLQENVIGTDSYYKLSESFESERSANGTTSHGRLSLYYGLPGDEFGIRLHDLGLYSKGIHFRVKESKYLNLSEEMFFITRGPNELIPCDENFNPVTLDKRYTLHKRLSHFTVEGYITFDQDSAQYFERNTREYWKVADLGEFDEVRTLYKQLTTEAHEGMYLRALAYSVQDTTTLNEKALVIKRIKAVGDEIQ